MKIYVKTIHGLAYTLLFLPFSIFVIGWLKPVISIPVMVLILILSLRLYKHESVNNQFCKISWKAFCAVIICALLMTWLGGGGGFFPQSYDLFMRNAIYRDLILEKWPVFYEETNRALVYYFGFWLIPASVCKIFLPVTTEYGIWLIARCILFMYMFLYILVIMLMLIITITRITKNIFLENRKILIICFIFFIWGNLSIIGVPFSEILNSSYSSMEAILHNPLLLEHWAGHFAIENANMLQIMNVYNQALPAWLGTLFFLSDQKNIKIYGCISLPLALLAPFPMLGLIAMMFVAFVFLSGKREIKFAEIFSIENFLSLPFVIVIIPFFAGLDPSKSITLTKIFTVTNTSLQGIATIFLFCFLTFGIYGLFCIERKSFFFKAVIFLNFIFCFICVGGGNDFQMRTTIPFSIYFMVCVIHLMVCEKEHLIQRRAMKIVLLLIAVVPILNIIALGKIAIDKRTLEIENDSLYTLSNIAGGEHYLIEQYTKLNPSKDIFFKYMAKGEFSIGHPVIEYQKDEQGEAYVSKVSLTNDMINLVDNNTQSTSSFPVIDMLQGIDYNGIEVIEFDEKEVIPVIANNAVGIKQEDIGIIWKNYHEDFSDYPEDFFLAVVDLSYFAANEIKYCDESRTAEWESGISVSLADENGNTTYYPYSYAYTKHVIYPDSTEKFLLYIPKPKEQGEYYLKFNFFYTDGLKQNAIIEDDTLYKIAIK